MKAGASPGSIHTCESGGSFPSSFASAPVRPPISAFTTKCVAFRATSFVANESRPAHRSGQTHHARLRRRDRASSARESRARGPHGAGPQRLLLVGQSRRPTPRTPSAIRARHCEPALRVLLQPADSLNVSLRCGWSPNARQICWTVVRPRPLAFAMPRLLQCVSPRGVSSSVRTMTCSICSSLICRGAPGRGSSYKPSNRSRTNRPRHLFHILRGQDNTSTSCSNECRRQQAGRTA